MNNKQMVFIVGCPRSGSNLLRSMLNQKRDFFVLPETHFFDIVLKNSKKFDLDKKSERSNFVSYFLAKLDKFREKYWDNLDLELWDSLEFDKKELKKELLECNRFRDIYKKFLQYLNKDNNKMVVEKTPVNLHYLDTIKKYYPESKIIHTIRDGREVVASANKKWGTDKYVIMARWVESLQTYYKYYDPSSKDQLSVKYYQSANNPEKVVENIYELCEIEPHSNDLKVEYIKNNSSFVSDNKKGMYYSKNFTKYFSRSDQIMIESLLKKYLKDFSYDLLFEEHSSEVDDKAKLVMARAKFKVDLFLRKKGLRYIYK